MEGITSGKSTNLMNLTSNYHYHTVVAEDVQTLDMIQDELQKKGFLAKLQDYEPVDFWSEKE
jgi:transcriptional regulator of NAD metabolism